MTAARPDLILKARRLLLLNNRELADFLGVSLRTVQRHHKTGGVVYPHHVTKIVQAVYPRDPHLAQEIVESINSTLAQHGIQEQPKATALPPAPLSAPALPDARREHAEAFVCAAADTLSQLPRDVRPIVGQLFTHALALGVDLNGLGKLLAAQAPARKGAT